MPPPFDSLETALPVFRSIGVRRQVTPVTAGRGIATLIGLRHTLRLLGPLAEALEVKCMSKAMYSSPGSCCCRDDSLFHVVLRFCDGLARDLIFAIGPDF